jgi:hypothetical protein
MKRRIVMRVALIASLGLAVVVRLGGAQVPAPVDTALLAEFRALETAWTDAIVARD